MAESTGLEQKRAKVTGKPRRSRLTVPFLICSVLAAVVLLQFGPTIGRGRTQPGGSVVSKEPIQMTDLTATVEGGTIVVPMDTVKEKGLVRFTYQGKTEIPLLAYVAPSGEAVTAVSMCEPCSSTRFFIKGDKIVCSTCYTEWDLESLKGIRGGCTAYPPDQVNNEVTDGTIRIDAKSVADWKSRI